MEALVALLAELNDLKRQSTPQSPSLAWDIFGLAWQRILDGQKISDAALETTARAVAAARLGGIDEFTLFDIGFAPAAIYPILERSFNAVSGPLDPELRSTLRNALRSSPFASQGSAPEFVKNLARQPRAGATRPGRARMMLLPAESHADHCAMVAVYSVILAPRYGADYAMPFLAALIHHAHNAWLPDSGFTGEEMLGDLLTPLIERLRDRALSEMPKSLAGKARRALEEIAGATTPEAKTFHAADVLDRVLQMRWYEQAANFTLQTALDDLELVHAGPVQAFHHEVLREAGLW